MTDLPPPRRPLEKASPWPFAGMVGMACVAFLIGASVLVSPWWVVAGLALVWALALLVAIRWFTPHPQRVVWLPLALVVLWFAAVWGTAALT